MKEYEKQKERTLKRWIREREEVTDIAPLPAVVHPKRRARAIKSFKAFCESYFKDVFYLPWSDVHLKVIEKLESVICNGYRYCLAMPRGSGKTTLNQLAVLWAAMTGKAPFVVLIAANAARADGLVNDLKTWLETNDALLEDFPEICYPVRRLEGSPSRARCQKCEGERTRIDWKQGRFVLPTIKGTLATGACIHACGMTGSDIRGLSYTRPDGAKLRPSLVLIDDPQTREIAQSPTQCANVEGIIKADVLGMAGAGKKLACCVTCTVVAEDDVAQRLLDRTRNPEFRGERYQLLDAYPTNAELWEQYRRIRDAELQNDGDGSQATDFYRSHQEAMDEGARPTWKARFNIDEISAVQHAMNLKIADESSFLSEYQNLPPSNATMSEAFDFDALVAGLSGNPRGTIPDDFQFCTAFIDVHKNLLFWTLCAWDESFNGVVVDYGTFPEQRRVFTMADAKPTIMSVFRSGLEGAIYSALSKAGEKIVQPRTRTDGVEIPMRRLLIDANWGQTTDVVYQFIAESPYRASIYPSHGVYVGATTRQFSEYSFHKGDVAGLHWRVPNEPGRKKLRRCLIDTNFWKSFLFSRLKTARGDVGRLEINGSAEEHQTLCDHLSAERCTVVEARGRRVDEWTARPGRDNHWLDCLVGSAVGASIAGARLATTTGTRKTEVKRVSFRELMKR